MSRIFYVWTIRTKKKKLITRRIRGEIYCQQIFQNLLGRRCSPNINAMSSEKFSTPTLIKTIDLLGKTYLNIYHKSNRCKTVRSPRWQAKEIHRDIDRWYSKHINHPEVHRTIEWRSSIMFNRDFTRVTIDKPRRKKTNEILNRKIMIFFGVFK